MTVETQGDTLSSLDPEYPRHNDPRHQGDDHLRLIKQTLQSQFPGSAGSGFADVITAVEAEINALSGLDTSQSLQATLDSIASDIADLTNQLSAPVGTSMVFYQATPPTGWTQDETNTDCMMRVTGTLGAGGGTGGDWAISGATAEEDGAHNHNVVIPNAGWDQSGSFNNQGHLVTNTQNTYATSMNVDRTLTSVNSLGHTHAVVGDGTWRPAYIDVIVGIKD